MNQTNKKFLGIIFVGVLIVGAFFATYLFAGDYFDGIKSPSSEVSGSTATIDAAKPLVAAEAEINVEEAYRMQALGALILDVRTVEEWDDVRIPGAILIPLDELEGRLNEIPDDVPIVVQCRSGNRSMQGLEILVNAGFIDAASMAGGISDWEAAGYDVEKGK